jgi:chaperonin cofactor prefoldin
MRQRLAAVAGLLVLGGCASLGEQIQHQQAIIQRCDAIQESPQLPDWQVGERYLLERAGAFANCTLQSDWLKKDIPTGKDNKTQWKALCELDEILQRYEFKNLQTPPQPAPSNAGNPKNQETLTSALTNLSQSYQKLNTKLEALQHCIAPKLGEPIRTNSICVSDNAPEIIKAAADTTRNLSSVADLAKQEVATAKADLQLWFLTSKSSLQKLLSAETLQDDFIVNLAQNHAMTFLAERSYRQLKKTIASADKRIERLDEKAYGALTVGNWLFTPKLQQAIADSLPPQLANADKRDESKQASAVFRHELARAACNNASNSSETGMLQALLDGAFIASWHASFNQSNTHPNSAKHALGRNGIFTQKETQPPELPTAPPITMAPFAACNTNTDVHKVYSAYEWQTRRLLIESRLNEAGRNTPQTPGNSKPEAEAPTPALPREDEVRKLAKDAASRDISPAYLRQLAQNGLKSGSFRIPMDYGQIGQASIRQNIQSAWAEQSMVINSQISNDNRNANTIIVNPPPASPTPATPDLCPAIRSLGLMCTPLGGSWRITPQLDERFATFEASDNKLETRLIKAGTIAATFAAQNNQTLHAQIDGYASNKSADPLCTNRGGKLNANAYTLHYSNNGRISRIEYLHGTPSATPIAFSIDCSNKASQQGNLLLSAARAMWAAHLLERTAQGAIVIDSIRPHGNQLANGSIVDHAADRTVAITLEMR